MKQLKLNQDGNCCQTGECRDEQLSFEWWSGLAGESSVELPMKFYCNLQEELIAMLHQLRDYTPTVNEICTKSP